MDVRSNRDRAKPNFLAQNDRLPYFLTFGALCVRLWSATSSLRQDQF